MMCMYLTWFVFVKFFKIVIPTTFLFWQETDIPRDVFGFVFPNKRPNYIVNFLSYFSGIPITDNSNNFTIRIFPQNVRSLVFQTSTHLLVLLSLSYHILSKSIFFPWYTQRACTGLFEHLIFLNFGYSFSTFPNTYPLFYPD